MLCTMKTHNTPAGTLHVVCVHCAATNRVPVLRATQDPTCGRCGRELLDGHPVELDDTNFDVVASGTELPVVVDFWAPWCGPCRVMAPQFEQAARELKGRALLVKVNSDEAQRLASRFGIRSIPTLLVLNRGHEVARRAGALPAGEIVRWALRG
jgi:thioredoxin 2